MQHFKKRARILTEKLGGDLSYGHNGSLTFQLGQKSATFDPISMDEMKCSVEIDGASTRFQIPKSYIFDIMDKLGAPHLASSLLEYERKPILQLNDYITDENGQSFLDGLRQQIADDPSLANAELGGNRIIVEYYRGTLIISDDILSCATNVVDF